MGRITSIILTILKGRCCRRYSILSAYVESNYANKWHVVSSGAACGKKIP